MNLEYRHLLNRVFDPSSRVWIYQSSRLFSMAEALEIETRLNEFTATWKSHGIPVNGAGHLFFGQFIVLMADERATGVSGCSTDSSVRFIKEIEQAFSVSLFDRLSLAFLVKDRVELLPLSQLQYAVDNGFVTAATLYFNNLVQTKQELESSWIIPLGQSWLRGRLKLGVES